MWEQSFDQNVLLSMLSLLAACRVLSQMAAVPPWCMTHRFVLAVRLVKCKIIRTGTFVVRETPKKPFDNNTSTENQRVFYFFPYEVNFVVFRSGCVTFSSRLLVCYIQ